MRRAAEDGIDLAAIYGEGIAGVLELQRFDKGVFTLKGFVAHRIDHMLSGTRANIAVKLYGDELPVLQALTRDAVAAL